MSECSPNEFFGENPEENFRYFNQPIKQIPGYDDSLPQLLGHAPNCGLVWVNLVCVPAIKCLTLDVSQLKAERSQLVVIKEFPMEDDFECDIEVTECPEEEELEE
jgi:hypothetical protein